LQVLAKAFATPINCIGTLSNNTVELKEKGLLLTYTIRLAGVHKRTHSKKQSIALLDPHFKALSAPYKVQSKERITRLFDPHFKA